MYAGKKTLEKRSSPPILQYRTPFGLLLQALYSADARCALRSCGLRQCSARTEKMSAPAPAGNYLNGPVRAAGRVAGGTRRRRYSRARQEESAVGSRLALRCVYAHSGFWRAETPSEPRCRRLSSGEQRVVVPAVEFERPADRDQLGRVVPARGRGRMRRRRGEGREVARAYRACASRPAASQAALQKHASRQ